MSKAIENLFKYIFLAGLFISPFVFWSKADIAYEIPRVHFVIRWIEVLGILGIIYLIWRYKKEKIDLVLVVAIVFFLFATLISSFYGVNFPKSFWGNYYRADGLLTLFHLVSLSFLVSLLFKEKWLSQIIDTISLSSFLISLWALLESFSLNILGVKTIANWNSIVGISFGNPNFLAGYLLVTLPFTFRKATHKMNKKINIFHFFFLIQILAILQTRSRAGLLGIVVFLFLVSFRIEKYRKIIINAIAVFITILVTIYLFQYIFRSQENEFIAEGRERIIRKALLAVRSRPVLGWGWANFDYAFDSVDWPTIIQHDVYVDKAHSSFLEVLVTTGIGGFILYLLIILKVIRNLYLKRNIHPYLLISFLLIVFHSQTNIISIAEEVLFWIITGLSANRS